MSFFENYVVSDDAFHINLDLVKGTDIVFHYHDKSYLVPRDSLFLNAVDDDLGKCLLVGRMVSRHDMLTFIAVPEVF